MFPHMPNTYHPLCPVQQLSQPMHRPHLLHLSVTVTVPIKTHMKTSRQIDLPIGRTHQRWETSPGIFGTEVRLPPLIPHLACTRMTGLLEMVGDPGEKVSIREAREDLNPGDQDREGEYPGEIIPICRVEQERGLQVLILQGLLQWLNSTCMRKTIRSQSPITWKFLNRSNLS